MVEPAHQGSSPRLGTGAHIIFLGLFQDLTCAILSVVGDVPLDSEAPMVISLISRICRLSLSEMLIGVGCVRVFIGMSVCVCEHLRLYCVS